MKLLTIEAAVQQPQGSLFRSKFFLYGGGYAYYLYLGKEYFLHTESNGNCTIVDVRSIFSSQLVLIP